jgi:hypothetical protein
MSNEMKNEEAMQSTSQPTGTSRRGLLRIGGFTLATAIIAACSDTDGNKIGTSGTGATTPQLPDAVVDNGVLLRTMAGLETSIANAYQRMIDESLLSGPSGTFPSLGDTTALVTTYQKHHVAAAKGFNELAVAAGAEAWTCGNTRYDEAFITPVFNRVLNGAEATDTALAIAPSDDPVRDFANLVHTLETLSAESCQALVVQVTEPGIRAASMGFGVRSARQAALMALHLNPGAYVSSVASANAQPTVTTEAAATTTPAAEAPAGSAPPLTEIPLPVAIPSQFGALSAITYIGGAGDENGVRLKYNVETPSLNSYAYAYASCAG